MFEDLRFGRFQAQFADKQNRATRNIPSALPDASDQPMTDDTADDYFIHFCHGTGDAVTAITDIQLSKNSMFSFYAVLSSQTPEFGYSQGFHRKETSNDSGAARRAHVQLPSYAEASAYALCA